MIEDAERAEFHSERIHSARKEHKCYECGRIIRVGEKYEYTAAKWDGDIHFIKTCSHCKAAKQWLVKQCGGYVWGGVKEDLREHMSYAWLKVGRLVVGMRRQWEKRGHGLMPIPEVKL